MLMPVKSPLPPAASHCRAPARAAPASTVSDPTRYATNVVAAFVFGRAGVAGDINGPFCPSLEFPRNYPLQLAACFKWVIHHIHNMRQERLFR